jgi:hypothetical protein
MIQVEFVEGSRSQLRMVISEPAAEAPATALPQAADLLFSALRGKFPEFRPHAASAPVAERVAAPRAVTPLSADVVASLENLRRKFNPLFKANGFRDAAMG